MSVSSVKEYLLKYNAHERVLEFDESSATVELAALAVGCKPERIAKSLSFLVNDSPVLIVAAGDARVDNKKFKDEYSVKAKMIPWDDVEGHIGHAPGGVCPFAVKENVEIYLDDSLKRFDSVYPAAGSSNSAIKLTLNELEEFTDYIKWVDVCKNWE